MNEKSSSPTKNIPPTKDWRSLYKIAGISTILSVVLMLADFYLSFTGADVEIGTYSTVEWFTLFHEDWFIGLRNLGIFNILNPLIILPLYLALIHTHFRRLPVICLAVVFLFISGVSIYIANNGALVFLSLTNQYYQTASISQKEILETAGTVVLAQSEDFTPGSFPGLFIQNLAAVILMVGIVKGQVFPRWKGILGLVGTMALMTFTIGSTFLPGYFSIVMALAMVGGMLMLVWNISMAINMLRWNVTELHEDYQNG